MTILFAPLMNQLNMSYTPHCTRHTCVSLLTEAGVDERINFSVPKGMKQVIKDLAADKGMSMNKYFLFLVE